MESIKTPIGIEKKSTRKRDTGKVSTKTKRWLEETEIRKILQDLIDKAGGKDRVLVCIEEQHPMSKQGLGSTAKTMYGYGFLVGVAKGLGLEVKTVRASIWQNALLDQEEEDTKKASIDSVLAWNKGIDLKATKRSKKADHNKADSINIARYAHRLAMAEERK